MNATVQSVRTYYDVDGKTIKLEDQSSEEVSSTLMQVAFDCVRDDGEQETLPDCIRTKPDVIRVRAYF